MKLPFSVKKLQEWSSALVKNKDNILSAAQENILPFATSLSGNVAQPIAQNNILFVEYATDLQKLAEKGTYDGIQGIPAHGEPSHTEREIQQLAEKNRQLLQQREKTVRLALEKQLEEKETALATPKSKQDFLRELTKEKTQRLEQAGVYQAGFINQHGKTIQATLIAWKEQLWQWKERNGQCELAYQRMLAENYAQIAPKKKWTHSVPLFWLGVMLLFGLEIGVNFIAFQENGIGDNNASALILGVFFAAMQALSAKAAGKTWQKQQSGLRNLYLAATLIFCLFMSLFRFNMEVGLLIKIVYLFINLVIAGVTVAYAYFHEKDQDFFAIAQERNALRLKIVQREEELVAVQEAYDGECERIETEIDEKAEQLEKDYQEDLRKEITQLKADLVTWGNHCRECVCKCETEENAALAAYRHYNREARRKAGVSSSVEPKKEVGKPNSSLNGKIKDVTTLSVWLLFAFLGLTACQPQKEIPAKHIEVVLDRTDMSHLPDVEAMRDYILSFAFPKGMEEGWGDIHITLSEIGETSTPYLHSLPVLEASKPFWERHELKQQETFDDYVQGLEIALDSLTRPGQELDYSYIHRNLFYRFHWLASQEGEKIMLIWSDLIANDTKVNFYDYERQPERIWEERDTLITHMSKDYPLPDLTDMTLINIHQSSKQDDALHEVSKRYFYYYWQQHGLTAQFKTVTPVTHLGFYDDQSKR